MNPLIQPKTATSPLLITLTLLCFGFFPKAQAVVPPPDGGYPGFNTAEGQKALFSLTTATGNVAVGWASLYSDAEGNLNTAIGTGALLFNTADQNTATGAGALLSNTTGNSNTATGFQSLFSNTEGIQNTASGAFALFNNTQSVGNTAIGWSAGQSITGDGNVCIGASVNGEAGTNNRTYIRNVNTFTQNFSAGVNDYVTVRLTDGRLGHTAVVSSRRYKEDIKPLDTTSQGLYALKPVSFRLKKEFDPTQPPGFGLIAEEVEKVNPDLVYRNDKGQVESVRYEMVNAMLLNEFLKEHKKVGEQQATIAELKSTVAQQQKGFESKLTKQEKQIEAVTAGLQKVSAQLELNKLAPQTVKNDD
jgi:hypothetical protein